MLGCRAGAGGAAHVGLRGRRRRRRSLCGKRSRAGRGRYFGPVARGRAIHACVLGCKRHRAGTSERPRCGALCRGAWRGDADLCGNPAKLGGEGAHHHAAHPWPQVDAGFGSDNPDGTQPGARRAVLAEHGGAGRPERFKWSADGVRTGAPQTASAWSLCDDAAMAVEAHRLGACAVPSTSGLCRPAPTHGASNGSRLGRIGPTTWRSCRRRSTAAQRPAGECWRGALRSWPRCNWQPTAQGSCGASRLATPRPSSTPSGLPPTEGGTFGRRRFGGAADPAPQGAFPPVQGGPPSHRRAHVRVDAAGHFSAPARGLGLQQPGGDCVLAHRRTRSGFRASIKYTAYIAWAAVVVRHCSRELLKLPMPWPGYIHGNSRAYRRHHMCNCTCADTDAFGPQESHEVAALIFVVLTLVSCVLFWRGQRAHRCAAPKGAG